MFEKITPILFILAISTCVYSQPHQFRGADRDGVYPDNGLLDRWPEDGPELAATIEGIGDGYGSPSMNEKGLFIAGMIDSTGYIFHYDHGQQLQWKVPYGKEFTFRFTGARGTPTLENERLYYSGTLGDAFCLDTRTGEFIWKKNIFETYRGQEIKWGYTESPLIYQDLVILTPGGPGHNVVALDKSSGALKWSLDLDSTKNSYCSPQLIRHGGQDLVLMNTTDYLLFLNPNDGKVVFSHPISHPNTMHAVNPLYLESKIFYSSGYGEGAVMFRINDEQQRLDTIYYNSDLDCKLSGLLVADGTVFGTSDRKKQWVGVDLASGETVFTSRELKPGSFLQADGKFFIFTETGVAALAYPDRTGFKVASSFSIPVASVQNSFAHPVLYKGILYLRYREQLWLYNVSKN